MTEIEVEKMTAETLAQVAFDEIKRRLAEYDGMVGLACDYAVALGRAAQLIDYATDRQINPKDYEGEILKMYRDHCKWIETQRAKGLFPALHGTKAPVARPKTKAKKRSKK